MSIYARDKDGNRQKIAGVGLPGLPGKSAYQYAVEGGFVGTEAEFAALVGVRSNPNLLDNWYFADPINQKGQEEYTGYGYAIDRWIVVDSGHVLSIKDGYLSVEAGMGVCQRFEKLIDSSKELTASLLTHDGKLKTSKIVYGDYAYDKDGEYKFYYGDEGFWFRKDGTIKLTAIAIKLELGPVQTLAHQDASGNWVLNDPPPDKALELAKCQRYYINMNPLLNGSPGFGFGISDSASKAYIFVPVPVQMRVLPTISFNGVYSRCLVGTDNLITSANVVQMTPGQIILDITTDKLTTGNICMIYNGLLTFDANL